MDIAMKGTRGRANILPMSEAERRIRRDLAACYRLVAMNGWDDLLATHISARLPDAEGHVFLINPIGLMFDEMTASSLVKVNLEGDILQDTPHSINRAGFVIHSAVHGARPDAQCVIHLHTTAGVAVSALEEGLLPLNQTAMIVAPHIAFHAYEGVATSEAERARIVADLGDRRLMLLRNHGTLSVADSIAEAFMQIAMLEWACAAQVQTLSMGRPLHDADEAVIRSTGQLLDNVADSSKFANALLWPALLRKITRINPGFED
jgi:ribulose-5-phosphate 4-epimerase/fuculose-1-phosphate aldolase